MKKCVGTIAAVLLGLPVGKTGAAVPGGGSGGLGDLRPALFTNKQSYALGEPVFLRLVLANQSNENTYEVQGHWHPANDVEIQIARRGEMPQRYFGDEERNVLYPTSTLIVGPRTIRSLRWTLCYEPEKTEGFLFDQPGQYTIACQARGLMINQVPRSVPFRRIAIEVRPLAPQDQEAFDLIKRPECAEDLQHAQEGRVREDTEDRWRELLAKYPQSPWAPYARMLLAWREWDIPEGNTETVIREMETILAQFPDFPLRDTACYARGACQDRLGKPLAALQWLYRLQREYPASPHLRVHSVLFRKYLYYEGWEETRAPWYLRQ